MPEAVSPWPVTAEARFGYRASQSGIYGVKIGAMTGFSTCTSVFPSLYHSSNALCSYILKTAFIGRSGRRRGGSKKVVLFRLSGRGGCWMGVHFDIIFGSPDG
jgi:hypothetical protein